METSKGKKELYSDARLHLEKLQRQRKKNKEKNMIPQALGGEDEELQVLEKERRILAEKS